MKKITALSIAFMISFQLFSQEIQPVGQNQIRTDYLTKSKNQRTAGWILTGTGTAVMGIGLAVSMAEVATDVTYGLFSAWNGEEAPETHSTGGIILLTGTAMLATGITFLSIAKKNKRKAYSVSFINESSQQLRYNTVMNTSVPSVRLRLHF